MAYTTYGKKVYASIQDLPQYTNIINGDKIIIWNETRDGAATVDFADLLIDLEHCTFKSVFTEVITLASDIESFVNTVNEEIENISKTLKATENSINNELRARIKSLEFIVAVMLGANSYWLSSAGLDNLKSKFIIEGINPSESVSLESAETDEERNALKWYGGFMSTVQNYISKMSPGINMDDILLQSKYRYKFSDIVSGVPAATSTPVTRNTSITTTSSEKSGSNWTDKTKTVTTIQYN
jgi:hypothetical protein